MTEPLGGFDPRSTYDGAARDYEDAARDFWQYISIRTVERLDLRPGDRVLDVPCGSGASLVVAGHRVGKSGHVVGIDYADQMVTIAKETVRSNGLDNVRLEVADMMTLDDRDFEPFDAVVCSLGLFFADDMPALLRSLVALVRPVGGRLGVAVFGDHTFDPMRHVFTETVRELAPDVEVLEPWRRTENVAVLRGVFAAAGIEDVTSETHDDVLPLASPDDWWRIVMGSGFRRTLVALNDSTASEIRRRCDAFVREQGVNEIVNRSHYAVLRRGGH